MVRLLILIAVFSCGILLGGCSDLKFLNAADLGAEEADPREDVRLTGVAADITSGGLVERRVQSSLGVYSQARNFLELNAVRVEGYSKDQRLEGITSADKATVHLADKPALKPPRSRNDIEFVGNVRHRVPSKDDPSTDSVNLQTERLEWDQKTQRFVCPSYYKMTMSQPGKPPLVALGDAFSTTRDMRQWVVTHGGMTTREGVDVREEAKRKREEIANIVAMEKTMRSDAPEAKPIEIPLEMEQGARAPQIAPVDIPAGTPTSEIVGGRRRARIPGMAPPAPAPTGGTRDQRQRAVAPEEPAEAPVRATPKATPLSREIERAIGPSKKQ